MMKIQLQRHHQLTKSQSGVSMIELILGIGLIALVLTAIALMTTRAIQLAESSKLRQKAIIYAQDGIEQVRQEKATTSWNEFKINYSAMETELSDAEVNGEGFKRVITLVQNPDSDSEFLLTSTVTWTDYQGTHNVEQTTIISNWEQ